MQPLPYGKGLVVGAETKPKQQRRAPKQCTSVRAEVPASRLCLRTQPFPAKPLAARRRLAQQSLDFGFSASPFSPSCRGQASLSSDQGEDTVHPLFLPFLVTPHLLFSVSSESFPGVKSNKYCFTAHLPLAGDQADTVMWSRAFPGTTGGAPESQASRTLSPFGADSINDDSGQGGSPDPAEISTKEI